MLVPPIYSNGKTSLGPTCSFPAIATRYPNADSRWTIDKIPVFTPEWLPCAPCRMGYIAVKSELRDGPHVGDAANARLNNIDSLASLSRFGVFTVRLPYGPISLTPRSSAIKRTILGKDAFGCPFTWFRQTN